MRREEIKEKHSLMEVEVYNKLRDLRSRGLMYFEAIEKPVVITSYNYNVGHNEIKVNVSSDDGEEEYVLKKRELDGFIKKFWDTKQITKTVDTEIVEENKPALSEVKKDYEKNIQYKDQTPVIIRNPDKDVKNIRDILFDTITKLKNDEIDVRKAQAIGGIAQVVLNAIKLENQKQTN